MLGFNICFLRTETLHVEDQDREFPIAVLMSKTNATRPIQDRYQDQNSDLQSDQELDSKNCFFKILKLRVQSSEVQVCCAASLQENIGKSSELVQ